MVFVIHQHELAIGIRLSPPFRTNPSSISPGHHRTWALGALSHTSNSHWWSVLHMVIFHGLQNHCRWWLQPWNKRTLTSWKKSYEQSRQHIKKQRLYFANKDPSSQGYGFSSSHVWMWELNYKESWVPKNWRFWTVVLEKTLESPLDYKEALDYKWTWVWASSRSWWWMVREVWGAAVHGVEKSQTWLSDWTNLKCFYIK